MTQSDPQSPALVVVHPIALLAMPALGSAVRAFLDSGETLIAGQARDGFIEVQTPLGQRGFVPAAACTPLAVGTDENVSEISVGQPVVLYRNPVPGTQFAADSAQDARWWMVLPKDPLMLLGRDQAFALVQWIDGEIGYIPVRVCPGRRSWVVHSAGTSPSATPKRSGCSGHRY